GVQTCALPIFKNQRCLIPASGFYEWKGEKANKTPFYVHPTQEPIFAFAGIYSRWRMPDSSRVIPSYTIITTQANKPMEELHHRDRKSTRLTSSHVSISY